MQRVIEKIKSLTDSSNKKRLISNFFSLIILRGFQFLIPLVTLPYLVRTIGIEKFGLVNFALSLGLYFGAVIQFGFGITATREIARNRQDSTKLAQIYSTTLMASVFLAGISALIYLGVVFSFNKFNNNISLYLATLMFIVFQSLFPVWFFQGMEKMKYVTLLSLGTSTIFLISLFVFVKKEDDFIFVPLLNAAAAFITLIIAITLINKKFKINFILPKIKEIKSTYRNGHHAFVSQLAPNFYNNSAVLLLGLLTNNTLVGLYTAATRVIDAVISFAYILSNTFLPYLSRNLQHHKVFQKIMLASGLALTIATLIAAEWITTLLFSVDNLEVVTYIQGLAISILLLFITTTYGTNFLMLIGKDRVVRNIALYTSLIFFSIAMLFISYWGIWGAIATLVGARLTMMLSTVMFYCKYKDKHHTI